MNLVILVILAFTEDQDQMAGRELKGFHSVVKLVLVAQKDLKVLLAKAFKVRLVDKG